MYLLSILFLVHTSCLSQLMTSYVLCPTLRSIFITLFFMHWRWTPRIAIILGHLQSFVHYFVLLGFSIIFVEGIHSRWKARQMDGEIGVYKEVDTKGWRVDKYTEECSALWTKVFSPLISKLFSSLCEWIRWTFYFPGKLLHGAPTSSWRWTEAWRKSCRHL